MGEINQDTIDRGPAVQEKVRTLAIIDRLEALGLPADIVRDLREWAERKWPLYIGIDPAVPGTESVLVIQGDMADRIQSCPINKFIDGTNEDCEHYGIVRTGIYGCTASVEIYKECIKPKYQATARWNSTCAKCITDNGFNPETLVRCPVEDECCFRSIL